MTVWVYRDGEIVDRATVKRPDFARSENLSTPNVSRFEAMESPVTGKEITSWRARDRDMDAAGAVDPRDLPRAPFEKRKRDSARQSDTPIEWGGIDRLERARAALKPA